MTVRILDDIEEALSREVRRITFHDKRSPSHTVLKEAFDPFTGELVEIPVEPEFYDSSADANHVAYPYFFIKLMKMREDRFSQRGVPQYGKPCVVPVKTSPKAFEIITYVTDGNIPTSGNSLITNTIKIHKISSGNLLRIFTGDNKGTYTVQTVNPDSSGNHEIIISPDLLDDLPELTFQSSDRNVIFRDNIDLSTVESGDIFEDNSANTFNIVSVDADNLTIEIDGSSSPDTTAGGKITRPGDVLEADGPNLVFSVMDPSKPITTVSAPSGNTVNKEVNPQVPIDLFYMVRIDSRERNEHIHTANRMWEEFFNPPRGTLPTITRSALSAEQLLTEDIASGGSQTLKIGDNSNFNVNDEVFLLDDFSPTKSTDGGIETPFSATIVSKNSTDELKLDKTIPDSFVTSKNARIVSNAENRNYLLHFVDHNTKDVEGSQYWVHEFTCIIQVWIDRQGEPDVYDGIVQQIEAPSQNSVDDIIIDC